MKIVIVGGGILGTTLALESVSRGHHVIQLEREAQARGATVRNFGLVWVSGRAEHELQATLRSRELWSDLGAKIPGIGFRAAGSITVVRTEAELRVAAESAARADAGDRGFRLLDVDEVRRINPALRGEFAGGLHCTMDAAVESRVVLPAMRAFAESSTRYTYFGQTEARDVVGSAVIDDHGRTHTGDLVVVCPGAAHGGLLRELAGQLPIRRVRLQMMQTAPLGEELTTAVADGDSMRYYPGFAGAALDTLRAAEAQHPVAQRHHMQLLCVQRLHGGLTIGDTHEYSEPFAFDVDEQPYEYLRDVTEALLGRSLPPVVLRWAGVYSQCTDPGELACRREVDDGVWIVTGPGGRGMTLGPVIAEQTADALGL
ncbi:FAD-dependent oxidoreductase [Mycobacterium sp. djl-10]|jgi:FAD dependent oxidoreductase TIGR03364|nr:FAD-dependent oxidoreductase [Mycobacterium sp. djl-10]